MSTTMGIFSNSEAAESAINELKGFGVSDKDISYIYRNDNGNIKDAQTGDKVGEGTAEGAGTGALLGGIIGLVVANGVLPGLGTLFVAGPLATALGIGGAAAAGAATGAVAGGLIGALSNMGVNDEDAEFYKKHVESGDILVIAKGTPESTLDVFENNGAEQVRQYISEE